MVLLSTDPSVRKGTGSDLPAVLSLVRVCIADMVRRGIDQWDEIYPARANFEADLSSGSLHVAYAKEGVLAGVFTLNGTQDPEYAMVAWSFLEEPVAVVHRLMVDPRFQGRGVARGLMTAAERLAAGLGFAVVRLDAFSLNPRALQLYRGLGYREAGEVVFRKGVFRCFEKRLLKN